MKKKDDKEEKAKKKRSKNNEKQVSKVIQKTEIIGDSNSVTNVVYINQQKGKRNTTPKPNDSNITQQEAAEIKLLVDKLGETGVSYGFAYKSLYKKFKVSSYTLIRKEDMKGAVSYLKQWIGNRYRTNGAAKPKGKEWRNRHYAAIKANIGNGVYSEDELESYVMNNFNKNSLTLISNDELDQARKWADRLKKKSKAKPMHKPDKVAQKEQAGFKVTHDWENEKTAQKILDDELNKRGNSKKRNDYLRYLVNKRLDEVGGSKAKAIENVFIDVKRRFPSLKEKSSFRSAVNSN